MSLNNEQKKGSTELNHEEYSKAMNSIGQNLLASLTETMQNLAPPLQTKEVAIQGLAAFLTNFLHRQAPKDSDARLQMHDRLNKIIQAHLASIS